MFLVFFQFFSFLRIVCLLLCVASALAGWRLLHRGGGGQDFLGSWAIFPSLRAFVDEELPLESASPTSAPPQNISAAKRLKRLLTPLLPYAQEVRAEKSSSAPSSATNSNTPGEDTAEEASKKIDILNITTEEVRALQSLSTRSRDLDKREQNLEKKEKTLHTFEQLVNNKINELENICFSLKALTALREKQQTQELKGIVSLYESMKPEKAAGILSGVSADVLVDIVQEMPEKKLSPILAAMNPVVAQKITQALVERRRLTYQIQQIKWHAQPGQKP